MAIVLTIAPMDNWNEWHVDHHRPDFDLDSLVPLNTEDVS